MKSTEMVGSSTAIPSSRSGTSAVGDRPADLDRPRARPAPRSRPPGPPGSRPGPVPRSVNSLVIRLRSTPGSPSGTIPGVPSGSSATASPTRIVPALDPPDGHPAQVRRVVEGRDQHLERPLAVATRRGDVTRGWSRTAAPGRSRASPGRRSRCRHGSTCTGTGASSWSCDGLEIDEQLEHLVVHPQRLGVRPVDLVDHHDRLEPQRQRLAGHEPRLRHRPLGGVHQDQHAVHHAQDPLHLAAEVGVARACPRC